MKVAESFSGLCCIKGCDIQQLAAGLCNKHWRRNKKYGSPVLLAMPAAAFRGMPVLDRFWTHVSKGESCWNWTGGKDQDGYGSFRGEFNGRIYQRAHRFSWAYHNKRDVPSEMNICHSCDNPSCVNPTHLSVATVAENQAQKWERGRGRGAPSGEKHYRAKLKRTDVRAIRLSTATQEKLAAKYGVTSATIGDIRRRKSWAHIA